MKLLPDQVLVTECIKTMISLNLTIFLLATLWANSELLMFVCKPWLCQSFFLMLLLTGLVYASYYGQLVRTE